MVNGVLAKYFNWDLLGVNQVTALRAVNCG